MRGPLVGRPQGGLNSEQHVLADATGRRIYMFLSAGQTSDYIEARALQSQVPQASSIDAEVDLGREITP